MLAFLHLSDIHFNKYSGDSYDVDNDLRNEVILDIVNRCKKNIPVIDGILICGDIAFSGQEDEYIFASEFLDQICKDLSIDRTHIFCVPGNHDVDQNITRNTLSVKLLQQQLENTKSQAAYDDCLAKILHSPQDAEMIISPIKRYNETFAAQYSCDYTKNKLMWQSSFSFDAGYNLCLVGLNSTMISSEKDHISKTSEKQMCIGNCQIPTRNPHTVYLSLCHHPPECWRDPEKKLSEKMNDRVAVQLYGHKHVQTIRYTEKTLIVGSGATHPCRTYGEWTPRYNWITLSVDDSRGTPYLIVRIYPRVLNEAQTAFGPEKDLPDGTEYREYQISLERMDNNENCLEDAKTIQEKTLDVPKVSVDSWERKFIYDFMNLSYFRRRDILAKLNLDRPEDGETRHICLLDCYIERAKEQNCVEQLIEEVRKAGLYE